jgi:alkylhydroperoxidase family enzyme
MSARLTRIFETNPLAAPLPPDLQAMIALTVKVTASPGEVTPQDVRAAFSAAHSPREYFDAAGVVFAFNFITRVVNALGVEPEIPRWIRRIEPLRQLGLRAMGLFFRWFVDLDGKKVHGPTPAEHLAALGALFNELGFKNVPAWLERLSFAPPLLAAIREFLEALVRRDTAKGSFDANQFIAIGRTVLKSVPNAETLTVLVDDWRPASCDKADPERSGLIMRFAKDIATRSYTLTRERIDELRAAGLDDAEVLDVTVIASLWSAAARLEVLTSCLPALDPIEVAAGEEAMGPRPVLAVEASA